MAGVIKHSYELFEERVAEARTTGTMSRQERVRYWVENLAEEEFRLRDIRRGLPGVSDQTIRLALAPLKKDGSLRVEGSGPGAIWIKRER